MPVPGPPVVGRRSAGWVPEPHRGAVAGPSRDDRERDARLAELRERLTDRLPPAWRRARVGMPVPAGVVALLLVTALAGTVLAVLLLARPDGARQAVPARAAVPAPPSPAPATPAPATSAPATSARPAPPLVVHVIGQVGAPGVVEVPAGARVADAVAAAGGLTADADLTRVNLARALADGEQVHVPHPGEELVPAGGAAAAQPPAAPGAGDADSPSVVDLNAADQAALEALPGIGPVLAERILQWRDAHGRFSAVDELGEVSGIGTALLERLRPLVAV